jgi:predicted nucleic acid-binding protein
MKILLDTSVFISLFAKDDHFESALSLFRSGAFSVGMGAHAAV